MEKCPWDFHWLQLNKHRKLSYIFSVLSFGVWPLFQCLCLLNFLLLTEGFTSESRKQLRGLGVYCFLEDACLKRKDSMKTTPLKHAFRRQSYLEMPPHYQGGCMERLPSSVGGSGCDAQAVAQQLDALAWVLYSLVVSSVILYKWIIPTLCDC